MEGEGVDERGDGEGWSGGEARALECLANGVGMVGLLVSAICGKLLALA